ncbi:MAG: metallophosphoesterase [Kofleriaceae bacterium]|nr:metallophosphoesterase [Kofleriaceae bacterium]
MVRISSLSPEPVAELQYLNARSGGGSEVSRLEVLRADIGSLADELDAIVCCSDLQGMFQGKLLGVAVAELLADLSEQRALPPSARTGIILAGDLYSVPAANKRGGYGDVSTVWEAFAERFPWVVGVAGNHDDMTYVVGLGKHVHVLDGQSVVVDGLRIGGVGGIIGDRKKPGRRDEDEQLERIANVVAQNCDIVVLHEGPHGDGKQHGNPAIRAALDDGTVPLTVCGHCHWKKPLAQLPRGQILNVDARVVILQAST